MIRFNKLIKCLLNPKFFKFYIKGVSPLFELIPLINEISNTKTLIDIGSNKGQFGLIMRNYIPDLEIHSFEPILEELDKQRKILGKADVFYYNFALGNIESEIDFYITSRKDSSSVLKPLNSANNVYKNTEKRKVQIKKLDKILDPKKLKRPITIKLDVQGFELETLMGSEKFLDYADNIITEISFVEIYENQNKLNDLMNFIHSKKFVEKKRCNLTQFKGKKFQEDVLFSRVT